MYYKVTFSLLTDALTDEWVDITADVAEVKGEFGAEITAKNVCIFGDIDPADEQELIDRIENDPREFQDLIEGFDIARDRMAHSS